MIFHWSIMSMSSIQLDPSLDPQTRVHSPASSLTPPFLELSQAFPILETLGCYTSYGRLPHAQLIGSCLLIQQEELLLDLSSRFYLWNSYLRKVPTHPCPAVAPLMGVCEQRKHDCPQAENLPSRSLLLCKPRPHSSVTRWYQTYFHVHKTPFMCLSLPDWRHKGPLGGSGI